MQIEKLIYKPINSSYARSTGKIYIPTNFGFYNKQNRFRRIYFNRLKQQIYIVKQNKHYKLEINLPLNDTILFKRIDNLMHVFGLI